MNEYSELHALRQEELQALKEFNQSYRYYKTKAYWLLVLLYVVVGTIIMQLIWTFLEGDILLFVGVLFGVIWGVSFYSIDQLMYFRCRMKGINRIIDTYLDKELDLYDEMGIPYTKRWVAVPLNEEEDPSA